MTKTIILASCFATAQAFAGATVSTGKGTTPPPPPAAACVGPISYSNIGVNYFHTEFDQDVDGLDGVGLELEYSPVQNLYLSASASWGTGESDLLGDIDTWGVTAGIGGYVALTSNLDLAADAGGLWGGVDTDEGDSNDSGWYVRPHLRAKFDCLQAHIGAKFICMGSDSDDQTWEGFVNLFYEVAPNLDLAGGFSINDDAYTFTAGLRYNF